jgi:hypothetical protein
MPTVTGDISWRGAENPFPPAAVARISDLRPEVPTIKTAAVREIDSEINDYLAKTAAEEAADQKKAVRLLADNGKIIIIDGDYGTGKTHLAIEILDRVAGSPTSGAGKTRVIYHSAPGGTFLTLYTDLIGKAITPDEVLDLVLEFYADIVANTLRSRPFADNLVGQLESGDVDPQLVIDQFGLKEGSLRQELRERLSVVTGDESFSRALMLLLQPDLREAAWRWFRGGPVEQVLLEQGITKQIQTDRSALEALGVIALLYGRAGRRFVLIIDEMEKLVLTWDRSSRASAQAFKKMLEVFKSAGALLVVCGLPDIFDVLPRDPGRIDKIVRPSMLTVADVRWYIEETQEKAFEVRSLEPFTEDSLSYLIYLTGGVARDIVRFCYRAYEYAAATGLQITPSVIMRIAHNLSPGTATEMVRNEIDRILSYQGRRTEHHWPLGNSPQSTVDFWVPVGDHGTGCAILLVNSVLEEQHVVRLQEQLAAVGAAAADREVILVVSGYLAADLRPQLAAALKSGTPIEYHARSFENDFSVAINSAVRRLIPTLGTDGIAGSDEPGLQALREETDRIARQQANTLRLVQELSNRLLAADIATEERLDNIQRLLKVGSGSGRAADTRALPPVLENMFTEAQRSLAAYGDVRKFLDESFVGAAQEAGNWFSVTYRLREPDVFASIGVAVFLSDLLLSMSESIRTWFGSLAADVDVTPFERERLRVVCRTFDALYAVTPTFKLDPLPDITSVSDDERALLSGVGKSTRRQALIAAFEGLGDRIYQAAVELAGGASDTSSRIAN